MAVEITMPKLSDTMTDGSFIAWRKSVGERIERGEVIAEVETDKAVMELEAFASGVLLKTMAKVGETVPVGTVLGLIGEPGELTAEAQPASASVVQPTSAVAKPPAEPPVKTAVTTAPPAPSAGSPEPDGHEKASPLVRHMARELGIDLSRIQGSGPEGRILQEDLQGFVAQHPGGAASPPEQPLAPAAQQLEPAATATRPDVVAAPSAMRQAIAATVSRSWQEIPHFFVTIEIAMDVCLEIVTELKGGDNTVDFQDLVVKACAAALGQFPLLLGPAPEDDIHIGFAVALPNGLLLPVIRACQSLSPVGIAHETARLAEKARSGRLTSAELLGGRFSVSNLGMFGVDEFTALIMPGQVAILAVGAVVDRPVVRHGQIIAAPTMRVTLSCDHRVVDGAYAAAFLSELRRLLEQPVSLLIQQAT
ncbi:MAG: dihydrolipoamide acetyltransferase family protein [Pedobacter sp.]